MPLRQSCSAGKADSAEKSDPAEKAFPLILWVHGGAFVAGDKAGVENWGVKVKERYFAKEEYGEVPHEYQMRLETKNAMDCFGDVLGFLEECM